MTLISTESDHGVEAPQDSVTLLLADIEGSTRLVEALGQDYPRVRARARALLDQAMIRHGGSGSPAEGDGFFAIFRNAGDGVRAAVDIQRAFQVESWPRTASVRVRIGLHTGQPRLDDNHEYYGLDVHRAARIAAAACGGQVLMSASTRQLTDDLPDGVTARDLGAHRLKSIRFPEILFDLLIPGVPDVSGPIRQPDTQPNNLPTLPTTFVGRTRQLREVRDLLLRPDTRLLTLTGPGGTGKTRLALEVARSALSDFMHGVFFVQLAPVAESSLLASTIAQTLGVSEFASRTPMEMLTHHLGQRHTLLVLDNFEHLVEAATVVQDLLRDCPRLKVLVTSREGLNIRAEREYLVSPLDLPREGPQKIASLAGIESVQLLLDRVHNYDRDFTLTAENANAICSICARLDGLPLALELAASQLKLRTPQSLLEDLEDSLDVLGSGPRDLLRHQRTLNDTIAWSYRLLNAGEQQLFRWLSVFNGGSTLDSVIEVCSGGRPRADVMNVVLALVNKSLLTRVSVEGENRVGMLEVIHQFGRERLMDTPEHDESLDRHAHHYLALAERAAPGLVSRDQRRFVTVLLNEEDNLRAALSWGIQQRDANLTSRLLGALLWLWIPRGQFAEGRTWTARALETFAGLEPCRELALIFESAGWLQVLGGDYLGALPLFERSYEIFGMSSDPKDVARSKITLGVTCLVLEDPRGGVLSDEAVTLCQFIDDKQIAGLALLSAGAKRQFSGQDADASACYEASLRAFTESDNVFWPGQVLQNLAQLRLRAGDWEAAAALAARALDIGREYNYPMITNLSIAVMGAVALTKGAADRAAQFFGAVNASLSNLGVTLEPPDQAAMMASIEATKSLLSADAYATAFADGRGWSEPEVFAAVSSLRGESAR